MRKLGKILSIMIIVATVFCALPLQTAWAARGRVVIGETKASAASSFNLEIGETMDLNFYNASGYVYKTDNGSVFWKTSDSKIVSVDKKGVIKAVSAGKATISVTLTVARTRTSYEGSVTINVKEKNVYVNLYSYNRVKLVYPSAAEALAASKEKITVQRVRRYDNGRVFYFDMAPNITIDSENNNEINIDFNINKEEKYVFKAPGLAEDGVEMALEWSTVPKTATLRYKDAYMSEEGGWDITGENNLSFCEAMPVFELYDVNGVIIGKAEDGEFFEGIPDIEGYVRYSMKDYNTDGPYLDSQTSGVVRITSLNQSAVISAEWSTFDGKTVIKSNDCAVSALPYVEPDLETAEGIVVTNKTGNNINWTGSENWTASMPASTTRNVLFYFLGSDGKKYSGCPEAYEASDIYPLGFDYTFTYKLDKSSEDIAFITDNGTLTAYDEGKITVYISMSKFNETGISPETVIGVVNVTVTKAPDAYALRLDNNSVTVSKSSLTTRPLQTFNFTVVDQYGETFPYGANITVTAVDDDYSGTVDPYEWTNTPGQGKFVFDMTGMDAGRYYYNIVINRRTYRVTIIVTQ